MVDRMIHAFEIDVRHFQKLIAILFTNGTYNNGHFDDLIVCLSSHDFDYYRARASVYKTRIMNYLRNKIKLGKFLFLPDILYSAI